MLSIFIGSGYILPAGLRLAHLEADLKLIRIQSESFRQKTFYLITRLYLISTPDGSIIILAPQFVPTLLQW